MINYDHLREYAKQHQILLAIIAAILISLLLTVISVSIYVRSGTSRLDLSRPGYEQVREQVSTGRSSAEFNADGPITKEVVEQFQALYKVQADDLRGYSSFDQAPLSEHKLRLLN